MDVKGPVALWGRSSPLSISVSNYTFGAALQNYRSAVGGVSGCMACAASEAEPCGNRSAGSSMGAPDDGSIDLQIRLRAVAAEAHRFKPSLAITFRTSA